LRREAAPPRSRRKSARSHQAASSPIRVTIELTRSLPLRDSDRTVAPEFALTPLYPAAALAVTTEETTKFNGYGVTGPMYEYSTKFVAYAVVFKSVQSIPGVWITQ